MKKLSSTVGSQGPYRLGESLVDPALRQISSSKGTQRVSPKAIQVLAALAEANGGMITRIDLLDRVWPQLTVGEEVLTQAIAELRRAFRDSARAPRIIETVPKAGYRLLAPVRPGSAEDAGGSACAVAPAAAEPVSIAGSPDQDAVFVLGREHKQVTVLDCAFTDAAALAASEDAEATAETVGRLHRTAREIVERYGGTVAQWLGDGVIALFGAPHAVEDHPRRAIGAAIDLLWRFERESAADPIAQGDRVSLSIGIHTGPAVIGLREAGSSEIFTAVGLTTESAKCLRQLAPASVVLASQETCDLVGSEIVAQSFGVDDTGRRAFRIDGFGQRRSGVPRRARPSLSKFVGRALELDMLMSRLESLAGSGAQLIDIVGDPGIGKSRLVDEFGLRLAGSGVQILRAPCLPHGRSSPYLSLSALLREICSRAGFVDEDRLAFELSHQLRAADGDQPETKALLLQMLGVSHDSAVAERLTPEERQLRIFDGLHRLVALTADRAPLVLLFEDLHWVDASSEAWMKQEVLRLAGLPVLLLTTYRPGYSPPWQAQASATRIPLPPLGPNDSRALVRSVPRPVSLSDTAVETVVARAQGNPFFLEELAVTHSGEETDACPVPDTVQAVIAARIDRLPPADKRLLQIAAVIGARVPRDLLAEVDGLETGARHQALQRLQQAELLYERRGAPEHVFAFKHALTQEVAYQGLVARARRRLHRDIADILRSRFPQLTSARPEVLARHLTEAGGTREAIGYWHAAGRKAAARAIGVEAIAHYNAALDLIGQRAGDEELARTKLSILIDLGTVLQAVKGAGAAEVGDVYRSATDLSVETRQDREGFVARWGLWRFTVLSSEFKEAERIAGELLMMAGEAADVELDLHAHHAAWTTARFTGSLAQAIEHSEIGLALADPRFHTAPHYAFGGHDPICCARGTRAIVLGLQGRPDSARRDMDSAIDLAKSIGHRPSIAGVYLNAADLYLASRDRQALTVAARELRLLGQDLGFAMHFNIGSFSLGWCRFKHGEQMEGLKDMRESLQQSKRAGGTGREPYHYALFADCLAEAAHFDEARDVIEEAFDEISRKRQNHWAKSEAHRMLGEILLRTDGREQGIVERHFEEARAIAQSQGALSLELRAASSLARLWKQQGKPDSAETLLRSVYCRFEEGADHPDLRYAWTILSPTSP